MLMIYYRDKKLKKWLNVLEADIITIKNIDFMSLAQRLVGLVSLFNGKTTFVGYLMPKLFS